MNQFTKLSQIDETNSSVNDNDKIQDLYNHLYTKMLAMHNPKISLSEQGRLILATSQKQSAARLTINNSLLSSPAQYGFDKFYQINTRNAYIDIADVDDKFLPSSIVSSKYISVASSTLSSSKMDRITSTLENTQGLPEFSIHIDNRNLDCNTFTKLFKIVHNTPVILHIFLNELFAPSITNLDSIIGMRKNIDTILFDSYDFLTWDENGKIDALNDTIEKYLRSGNANEFIDELIDAGMEDWL